MAAPETTAVGDLQAHDADGLVGGVTPWPCDQLPGPKYRFCDGAAVSRADFSLLFSRYGTAHGTGDGSTTFNLPNYQGFMLIGVNPSDSDFDEVADSGGAKTHTLSTSEMPNHGHGPGSLAVASHVHQESVPGVTGVQTGATNLNAGNLTTQDTGAAAPGLSGLSEQIGGGGAHNNMPPYKAVHWIVKVV